MPTSIICPCCRASNETSTCRRCKADLKLLGILEENRNRYIMFARRFAADERYAEALQQLELASQLRPGSDILPIRAALLLLQGKHPEALHAYELQAAL